MHLPPGAPCPIRAEGMRPARADYHDKKNGRWPNRSLASSNLLLFLCVKDSCHSLGTSRYPFIRPGEQQIPFSQLYEPVAQDEGRRYLLAYLSLSFLVRGIFASPGVSPK